MKIFLILVFLTGCKVGTATFDGLQGGEGALPPDPSDPAPAQPTNLVLNGNLNNAWVAGQEGLASLVFSWTNPSVNFDHAEISVGVEAADGSTRFTDYVIPDGADFYTFKNFENIVACDEKYFPMVKSVSPKGVSSQPAVIFSGFRYDNEPPDKVEIVDVSAKDGVLAEDVNKSVTADWSEKPGSDECEIDHYEMAIGYDVNSNRVLDQNEKTNILGFTRIPGGKEVTRYQAENGIDGFSFNLVAGANHYTTIRVVDKAGFYAESPASDYWVGLGSKEDVPVPTELALSTKWVNGENPVSGPTFSWINPEIGHSFAQVNLGVYNQITKETEFQEIIPLSSPGAATYTWTDLNLVECVEVYFPLVNSVTTQGFWSDFAFLFDGFRYDNTNPNPVSNINVSAKDSSLTDDMDDITRAPTTTWSSGTGECSGIKYFEIAIGTSASDTQSILSFTKVPGEYTTASFQAVDGDSFTDDDGVTHTFNFKGPLDEEVDYFTSIRAVDNAGNTSIHTTSVSWSGEVFLPTDLDKLITWIDATDETTIFKSIDCSATLSIPVEKGTYNARIKENGGIDPASRIACLKDKSGQGNDYMPLDSEWERGDENDINFIYKLPVYLSNGLKNTFPAIHFFGTTLDGTEDGTPTNGGGNRLALKFEHDDFSSRTLFFVGDFLEVEGGEFTDRILFKGGKDYLKVENGVFTNRGYAGVFRASEDGVAGLFLSIAMEADLEAPDSNTSKKEFYIEGAVNPDYFILTQKASVPAPNTTGFDLGAQNRFSQRGPKDAFISEFMYFERYLPTEERVKVEGYLACKYNLRDRLPNDHPYSPNAPLDLGCPFKK